METGVLADWNDERGFGFIEDDGRRTFVHISAFDPSGRRPMAGDDVRYSMGTAPDGRPRAVQASVVRTRRAPAGRVDPSPGRIRATPLVVAAVFLAGLAVVVVGLDLPLLLPLSYLAMSVVTFGLYAADKRAALSGAWRIPEARLQLAALCCGWPGALVAQHLLRHKNRKPDFQFVFRAMVAFNVGACVVVVLWLRSDLPFPGIR